MLLWVLWGHDAKLPELRFRPDGDAQRKFVCSLLAYGLRWSRQARRYGYSYIWAPSLLEKLAATDFEDIEKFPGYASHLLSQHPAHPMTVGRGLVRRLTSSSKRNLEITSLVSRQLTVYPRPALAQRAAAKDGRGLEP